MSIDARIDRVSYEGDGTATLHLVGREPREKPGQPQLTVLNPVPGLEHLQGECIWGGSGFIMLGNLHWADRESYTTIRLRPKPTSPLPAAANQESTE